MYLDSKIFISAEHKLSEIIKENPLILLVVENFGIFDIQKEITIAEICHQNNINLALFIQICNLHNGYYIDPSTEYQKDDLETIISYLQNTHHYYIQEKYPEILGDIKKLHLFSQLEILKIIEQYFEEYFDKVRDHMTYEDQVAFPYFKSLIHQQKNTKKDYSTSTYTEHHTDIESKLDALKELFIEHIHINAPNKLRRKILNDLYELEFELYIHSTIEELILIPLVDKIEKGG